jgi:glyoxylase-like metal-dependent hydrolase (beta-lactamase superfamily II)
MDNLQTSPSRGFDSPEVTGFYESDTGSVQYVVCDPATRCAAVIDPVWNFDAHNARTSTRSADQILEFVKDRSLSVEWVLDTHPHADHFTAAAYLKEKLNAPHGTGERVREIAAMWRHFYNLPHAFDPTVAFDRLFGEGETFQIGSLPVRVMLSPGHTLGSITFIVGEDAAFVHDTLMVPDTGSSRADFPGGDARTLYRSIRSILSLPSTTRLFVGHDYCKGGRKAQWEATVQEHRAHNIHAHDGVSEDDFVKLRQERDRTLALPDRMLHALQVNLRGGHLPDPEDNGVSYFKIPANRF